MHNPEKLAIQSTQYEEKHNTIYVGHHYMQTNTNNVYKTWALLQTTGGKEEPNTVFIVLENATLTSNLEIYQYIKKNQVNIMC